MTLRNRKLLLLIPIAVLTIYWLRSGDSEEERLLGILGEAKILGEVGEEVEHPIERARVARKLASLVGNSLTAESEVGDFSKMVLENGRDLQQKIIAGRSSFSRLEIDYRVREVKITSNRAEILLELNVLGSLTKEEGQFYDSHLGKLYFEKEGSDWKLLRAVHLENLRDAGP